jgi:PKD repeat protein
MKNHLNLIVGICLLLVSSLAWSATHDVTVGNNFFSPSNLTIEVGDTVRWTNNSGRTHNVTGPGWASATSSSFTYERTFNSVEQIAYECTIHNGMTGSINVTQGTGNAEPNALFSSSCNGLNCDFTDMSTDSDGAITSRSWNFGDGGSSSATNPSHTYASGGIFSVTLTVTDNDGATDSETENVTVADANEDPNASFTFSCTGLDCNFTDQSSDSDGSIVSRFWSFGDGSSSTAQNPSHSYSSAGVYSVKLTVTDNDGASDDQSQSVTVSASNQRPNASFTSSCNGLDCSFTDQSTDSDGTIVSWAWTFGDGGSSTGQNPAHSYGSSGTYSVGLVVTDNDGAEDNFLRSVTVTDPQQSPFLINVGMTDAWFDPTTDGQGFFIIVWGGIKFMFLSWFTFDTELPPAEVIAQLGDPGQRWVTAQGPYDGDTATLDVFISSGGTFNAADPEVATVKDGTMTIKWSSCNSGLLTYDIPTLGLSGQIPVERIVLANVPICESGQSTQ